jgi:hypothetical protein
MWEPQRLTNLGTSTACYKSGFTLLFSTETSIDFQRTRRRYIPEDNSSDLFIYARLSYRRSVGSVPAGGRKAEYEGDDVLPCPTSSWLKR